MGPFFKSYRGNRCRSSFTLVELLVAVAVLVLLLAIIAAVTQSTALAVHQASGKLTTYAAARSAFDTMNEKLAQTTLNTYLDYYALGAGGVGYLQTNISTTFVPAVYGRVSNLHFIIKQNCNPAVALNTVDLSTPCYGQEVYFQCPTAYSSSTSYLSTQGLLNACGFYVQYCDNADFKPGMILGHKWRYRLMQAIEPTENFQVYKYAIADSLNWGTSITNTGVAPTKLAPNAIPLADNVIALIVWPQFPAAQENVAPLVTNYLYDSQSNAAPVSAGANKPALQAITANQLPPILQITMVVVDEASAVRIDTQSSTPPTVIENALKGRFNATSNYAADLAAVETSLSSSKIAYEVLNTAVVMRESKWSQ